jgi:aryl-alcohol dehydrogenase-like predicted oxidoreductase
MNPSQKETESNEVSRREFVKLAMTAGIAASSIAPAWASETDSPMPTRTFGRTGIKVSAIGLGGYHVGIQADELDSIRLIRAAIDRGITFLDNCWDYNDGRSEIRMGKALRDGYREKVFLMTKVDGRTAVAAARQIDESLRRLQVDHVDLMQFHENIRLEDPDRFFAAAGAVHAFLDAQKAGKIRFIGFTGHKDPIVHLRMLDAAQRQQFRFDAVQMPLNVMDAHFRSFGKEVLPRLVSQGIAALGMKSMGSGAILQSKVVSPVECLHYAMSLPTTVVITGIDKMEILDQAIQAAATFKPMTEEQRTALLDRTKEAAAQGHYELFKTTASFDGTAHNPAWLG